MTGLRDSGSSPLTTLGGSTIAAACGINPYVSPIRLWLEMTGRVMREPSEAMEWGTRLQPVIFDALRAQGYAATSTEGEALADDARPWLVGHPDGYVWGTHAPHLLEVKASARGYETPPVHYLAQVQTYLHLADAWATPPDSGLIATLAGLHLDVCEVERSQHQIDLLLHLGERFMRYVQDDVQPPPDGHPDDRAALVELWPDATRERKVRETREVRDARRELAKLVEREKASKARMETLRATIQNEMRDAEVLVSAHDEPVATWKNTTTRRFDLDSFKRAHPDLYEQFRQPSTTRRLLV